ncbi:MAG: hypothetical protein KDE27_15290 [Planctomycetes bacterium]|nr:hypothetical protein [Planctomycetota bacterium]
MKQILVAVLLPLTLASFATGQGNRTLMTSTRPMPKRDPAEVTGTETVALSTFGIDTNTSYFFRGMRRESNGFRAQPHLEIAYGITEGDGAIRNVDFVFGSWNDLSDGRTGTAGGRQNWYESDFYVGTAVGISDDWAASATYSFLTSPNGSFTTVQELALALSFDDSATWGEDFTGLHPTAAFVFEMRGQADAIVSNNAQVADRGTYGQIGIAPQFELGETADLRWTLTTPATVGLSFGNYYEHPVTGRDSTFGFLSLGAVAKTPFPWMPARFGPWQMTLSVEVLFLGNSTEVMNGGDSIELIGGFGMSTVL